ncbi:hypothetical protein L593_06840 [Salinarchaeum sp. Harcht-Bsk1]|uniref:hypothetical protein n=1 Tax=Salinarchaeum sp. Harcht-Bsk1 TaxID=1333523 RepID=UPI0003423787|nr:hypothetical protein [Salinarchaeum sp. Harcht-Bsk1]AGN01315.1 hypothetical protein L593_06840 [Salinarchaeum sp. Harcht-Bsk1]
MPSSSDREADSPRRADGPEPTPAGRTPSRRTVLHSIGAVGAAGISAGCAALGDGNDGSESTDGGRNHAGASQIHLHNDSDERKRISIEVTRETDSPTTVADRSLSLAPGEVVRLPEGRNVRLGDDLAVLVDVERGPRERYVWTDPTAEQAPLHVFVDGTDNVLFALQVG